MFKKSVLVTLVLLGYSSTAFAWKSGAGKIEHYWTLENGHVYIKIRGVDFMCRLNDNPEVLKRELAVVQLAIAANKTIGLFCHVALESPAAYPHHRLHRIDLHP
jgi:hypothetical protein